MRLVQLVIAGMPGEATAELGLKIKAEIAKMGTAEHVAVGGLADGWISYILSEEEYHRGGYETSVSFYGPELGAAIVDGVLAGVKQLKR